MLSDLINPMEAMNQSPCKVSVFSKMSFCLSISLDVMRSKHVGCTQGLSSFWGVGICQAFDRNWDPTGTTTLALGVY